MSLLHLFSNLLQKHWFCKEKENHTQTGGSFEAPRFYHRSMSNEVGAPKAKQAL